MIRWDNVPYGKGGYAEAIARDAYGKIELMGNSNVFFKNAVGVTVHLENGLSRQISGRNLLINNDILEEMIWQE